MAMAKAFFLLNILLVFGFFAASNSWSDVRRNEPVNANWVVDGLLNALKIQADPFYLSQIKEKFIQVSPAIYGLSRVERTGDAMGLMVEPAPTMQISIPLGVSNLQLQVNYSTDFGFPFYPFNGTIEGVITRLEVLALVKYNILTSEKSLEDFMIIHLGNLRVTEFTGLTELFNELLKSGANLLLESQKETVKSLLEDTAYNFITNALR